jgi:hypothetical protein
MIYNPRLSQNRRNDCIRDTGCALAIARYYVGNGIELQLNEAAGGGMP